MRIFELWGTIGLQGVERVNTALDNLGRRAEALGGKLSAVGSKLSTAITLPILGIGAAAAKMAMDAVESENLFEVSMGSMADSARKWSDETSKALGLNAYNVRKNVATYNAMLTSMGLTSEESLKMSEGLTQLSYDMASFHNLKPEEAFEKLKAGISGEAEPLKALGIMVDDATIKTYAYANGIAKQGAELTRNQKVQARYGAILEATKNAQGDLARTMDSPTNKLRIMRERTQQLSIQFGQILIPMLEKLMNAIQPVIEKLQGLSEEQRENIVKIALFAASIGPIIFIIGKLISGVSVVIKAFKAMSVIFSLTTLKVIAWIAAAAGIAIIGTMIYKSWEDVWKGFKKIWDLMGLWVEKLKLNVQISFKKMEVSALNFIDSTVKSLKVLEKLPFGIGDSFKEFGNAVTDTSKKAQGELAGLNGELAKTNTTISNTKLGITGDFKNAGKEALGVVQNVNDGFNKLFGAFKDNGENIEENFKVDVAPTPEEQKALDKLLETYEKEAVVTEGITEDKKEKTDASEKEKEALEREKKALDDLIISYEKESDINSISIEQMKKRQEQIDKELSSIDMNDKSKKDQIKILEDEKKVLDKTIISLENKKTVNDTVIQSLKDGINPIQETVIGLEKQKKAIDDSLIALAQQGISIGKNVDNLKAERETLETNIKSIKTKEQVTKDLAKQIANGTLTVDQAVKMLDKEKLSIEEVINALNKYKEEVKKLPTWQSQLEEFWDKFLNSGSKLGKFVKNLDEKFKVIKNKVKEFGEKNPLVLKIAKIANSDIGKVAKEIGDTMSGVLDAIFSKMDFGNVFQSLFKGDIAGTFKNLFGGIIGKSEEQTKTQLSNIEEQRKAELDKVDKTNQTEIDAINAKYDLIKAQAENSGFSGLMNRFNGSFEKVLTKLMPVFERLIIAMEPMIEPMTQVFEILALMLIEILNPMTPLLIKLMEVVGELLQALFPVIEPLMELAVVIIDLVLGAIRPLIPVIRIIAELFGALIRVLKPIFEPFGKLFDAVSPLIEPFAKLAELIGLLIKPIEWIVDTISKVMGIGSNLLGGVADGIGGFIGGIVDGIGGVIGGIGDFFGFANGGLVTGPTRALIGEAGYPEAVIPLKSDVLGYLGQQIAMATPSNGNLNTNNSMFDDFEVSRGSGGDIIINFNGDNLVVDEMSLQRFARQLFPKLEAERKRRGQ